MDKKRICYAWRTTGLCRFGSSCRYAHDEETAYRHPDFQHRLWSHSQASTSSDGQHAAGSFSLMSYNVLADELALAHAKELYRAVPEWCLQWPVRKVKLMSEILHWRPDVICLQEIDHPLDFSDTLAANGYDWRYAARTGGRADGCLTLCLKDNVGLIVILRMHGTTRDGAGLQQYPAVAVANTHLLFNPKRGDIKLGQAGLILRRIATICQKDKLPPLALFTGDFNSTPKSAVYAFVRDGELDCYLEDRRNLSGQLETTEKGWPPRGVLGNKSNGVEISHQARRGFSLDDPSRSYRTHLAVTPEASVIQPMTSSFANDADATPRLSISQGVGNFGHCESSPCIADTVAGSRGLKAVRYSGPILTPPGNSALYPYADQYGQVAWSYMPPSNSDIKRQPFFHEPMRVEEENPPPPSPPPPGIFRTLSFAERQVNAGTWTTEQLMIATGSFPAGGQAHANAKGRSQLPRPSPTEVWIAEHPLPMQSTYQAVLGAEPAYTSCHGKFIGTVDYVWFTPQAGDWGLKPTSVLLPPPLECLHCGLPSPEWPSDHISLLATFTITSLGKSHQQPLDPMEWLEAEMLGQQHTNFPEPA